MYLGKRLRTNRKGQSVLPLTLGFVIFNAIWYILVIAFTNDGITIGTASNVFETEMNATGTDAVLTSSTDSGIFNWIKRFWINVFSMPWWLQVFVGGINGILVVLIVMSWVRGV